MESCTAANTTNLANKCNIKTGECQCGNTDGPCDASSLTPKCLGNDGAEATLEEGSATCKVKRSFINFVYMKTKRQDITFFSFDTIILFLIKSAMSMERKEMVYNLGLVVQTWFVMQTEVALKTTVISS